MNYEELLNQREGAVTGREELPFGYFYRKLIDRKYRHVIDLKPLLVDSIAFSEGLKADHQFSAALGDKHQLRYDLKADSGGIYELELESGTFQPLNQLLLTQPAVVTAKGFLDGFIAQLFDATEALHQQGALHLCFAPPTIFLRKGSDVPLLLFHGSFYQGVSDVSSLYGGFESFVAPEVLQREAVDERSDVYALGRIIAYLYESGSMPVELRVVVRKATAADPSQRYASVADMRAALTQKRHAKRSAILFAAALAIVVLCVAVYLDMVPQQENIEFLTPPPAEEVEEDPFDPDFDPDLEMRIDPNDTSFYLTDEERREMEAYQAKNEEIFRRRFTREADRILSRVYDNENMSANERNFMATSQSNLEELMDIQRTLADEAGITADKAGQIATEIITSLSMQKQAQLEHTGYMPPRDDDDDE